MNRIKAKMMNVSRLESDTFLSPSQSILWRGRSGSQRQPVLRHMKPTNDRKVGDILTSEHVWHTQACFMSPFTHLFWPRLLVDGGKIHLSSWKFGGSKTSHHPRIPRVPRFCLSWFIPQCNVARTSRSPVKSIMVATNTRATFSLPPCMSSSKSSIACI